MRAMDADAFGSWLERYFAAWASNEAEEVESLFAEDAVYSYGPFRDRARGREEIVRRWVRGGSQPGLQTWFEPLALEGERGVAHWRVASHERAIDGVWVVALDARGRCESLRQWWHPSQTWPG